MYSATPKLLRAMTALAASLAVMVCGLALAPGAALAQAAGHVAVDLGAQGAAVPGHTLDLALRQRITPGWHTYWRNPGDAGLPPSVDWTLPPGWKAGAFVWPAPKRLPLGGLMDYGYENEVLLPFPVSVPASAKPGTTAHLRGVARLLVCQQVCVPEIKQLSLEVPVAAAETPSIAWAPQITRALAAAPRHGRLQAVMASRSSTLKLALAGPDAAGVTRAAFFPYAADAIVNAAPQTLDRGKAGITLSLRPGPAFQKPPGPATLDGVVVLDGRAFEVSARRGALPPGAAGLGPVAVTGEGGKGGPGLPLALAFAFLGGVVLNLMPCVFPVLSMKALAIVRHGAAPETARREGVAFLAGVLATFVLLAGALLAARAAGGEVGWGFQLQSPAVVAALALLMLLIALNLSGVFEAGLLLQRAGGSAATGGGLGGAFLTGALAVVVAAPCTAPLMAAAIAYALVQPAAVALVIFLALGLGFAAPFTLLSFAPALLRRLPRPGGWMEALKKVLAFPMYAAAAWLLWVFTLQTSPTAMAALLAAAVVLALAAWLYGAAQQRQAQGSRAAMPIYAATGLAGLAVVALVVSGLSAPAAMSQGAAQSGASALPSQAFSPKALADLQAQGRPVLVDFTAAWCVTCQVNERVALSGSRVAAAFRRVGAIYMRADWTRSDPQISRTLAEHGRAGVPLYLVYPRGGGQPEIMGQVLTEDAVIAAIGRAARS